VKGISHRYMYMQQLPEVQDAYQAIVKFFRKDFELMPLLANA
jgi:hypothetical protein